MAVRTPLLQQVEQVGKGRGSQDRDDQIDQGKAERDGHQAPCEPDCPEVAGASFFRALPTYASHGCDKVVFASKQKPVERPENEDRREGQEHIERDGKNVCAYENAEKVERILESFVKRNGRCGRQLGVVLVFNSLRDGFQKHGRNGRGHRHH